MNKENPKKNKKSFEYYIAQRKEEFRCQYDHERSWENLQYKLQKRKNHRLSLYCVAASAAFLFLILGVSHIFSLHNNTQNKEAVVAAVVSFPETGSRKAILTLENGEKVDLSVKKGTIYGAYNEAVFSMVGENGRKALRTKGFKYDRENGLNISKRFSFT